MKRISLILNLLLVLSVVSFTRTAESNSDIYCLTTAIYHESRGESKEGQIAVASVIMNRTRSDFFPETVCEVVYQPKQFSDIEKSKPNYHSKEWTEALKIAIVSYLGLVKDPTNGAKWYFAHKKVRPWWAKKKIVTAQIGGHTFLNAKSL